jgi:hypothetical protein
VSTLHGALRRALLVVMIKRIAFLPLSIALAFVMLRWMHGSDLGVAVGGALYDLIPEWFWEPYRRWYGPADGEGAYNRDFDVFAVLVFAIACAIVAAVFAWLSRPAEA